MKVSCLSLGNCAMRAFCMIYQNVGTWKSIFFCASAWGCFLSVLCGAGIESRESGSGIYFMVTVPCSYLRSWDVGCLWLQHVGKQVVFCSLTCTGFLYLKSIAGSAVLSSWASWSHSRNCLGFGGVWALLRFTLSSPMLIINPRSFL